MSCTDKTMLAAGSVATVSAGLFAGAALCISAVEHPAAMETDVDAFYKYFPAMYKRAAPIQGSLAIVGATAAAVAASKGGHCSRVMWGGAGLLLGSVWPFTVAAMFPTNNKIKEQNAASSAEKSELLTRWGKLHLVRTVLSCTSFGLMVYTLYRVKGPAPKHALK